MPPGSLLQSAVLVLSKPDLSSNHWHHAYLYNHGKAGCPISSINPSTTPFPFWSQLSPVPTTDRRPPFPLLPERLPPGPLSRALPEPVRHGPGGSSLIESPRA